VNAAHRTPVSFHSDYFSPSALALAFVAILSRTSNPIAAALAAVIAIGYGIAVFFPCDPGSPSHGSFSQGIHNLAGGVQYIGGTVTLLRLGQDDPFLLPLAVVVGVGTFLICFPQLPWRGLAQRIAETALFLGLVMAL